MKARVLWEEETCGEFQWAIPQYYSSKIHRRWGRILNDWVRKALVKMKKKKRFHLEILLPNWISKLKVSSWIISASDCIFFVFSRCVLSYKLLFLLQWCFMNLGKLCCLWFMIFWSAIGCVCVCSY
jgi:hypothetical protein